MSRFHWAHDIRVGDRVENTQTGERGVTHAIYPADFEDDVEVRLDRGGYATWWGKYVRVISQYTPLQEAR
jgi:hypothetical protein